MAHAVRGRWSGASVLPVVVAALAAALALAGCTGQEQAARRPAHAPAGFDPTLPGWVACSRLIVEGDVVRVSDGPSPGRMVTELAVQNWIKPASGPKTARIETADIAAGGVYSRWQPGTHLFLQVDVDPVALNWQFPDRMMARIEHAVPASRTIQCPYGL